MGRRLSSHWTLWLKFIFPVLWVLLMAFGGLALLLSGGVYRDSYGNMHPAPRWPDWLLLAASALGIVWYWLARHYRRVTLTERTLIISDYFREKKEVPLTRVRGVFASRWKNEVTIAFDGPKGLRDRAVFIPRVTTSLESWRQHPIVEELRALIR